MDSIAENAGDEAEISTFDASNGNWSGQSASASNPNSTLLFIAVSSLLLKLYDDINVE